MVEAGGSCLFVCLLCVCFFWGGVRGIAGCVLFFSRGEGRVGDGRGGGSSFCIYTWVGGKGGEGIHKKEGHAQPGQFKRTHRSTVR